MNINLICPFNSLSFGVVGQNVLASLDAIEGVDVAYFPIPCTEVVDRTDVPEAIKQVALRCRAMSGGYDPTAPSLRIWHQFDLAEHVGKGLHVGFPFFELDRFTARERGHLCRQDRLFVASSWAADVVRDSNCHHDVRVVPLGVDRAIFHERVPGDRLTVDHTVFLNVGKWEIRKGHDILIDAFCRAFTPADKVVLIMASDNPFIGVHNDSWRRRYKGSPLGRNIRIEPRRTTQDEVARLMASADCGVFPSRAEGWNLPALEMLSMGKQVIATAATAHTAFMNAANSRLIDVDATETARDGVWFHGQGDWARLGEPQLEQLVYCLREVHRLKQTGSLPINGAGITTAREFSWDRTARTIVENLT